MKLFVRADAGAEVGEGHLTRCMALAHVWRSAGGSAEFITDCRSDRLRQRLDRDGFLTHDLKARHPDPSDLDQTCATVSGSTDPTGAWIVLDGYHFDASYAARVAAEGPRVLMIEDDVRFSEYDVDAVLNQNIFAERLEYRHPAGTRMMLGTRYVLLRPEFTASNQTALPLADKATRVLVTLGAFGPLDLTTHIIEAIGLLRDSTLEIKVIAKPESYAILESAAGSLRDACSRFGLAPPTENMLGLMSWAEVAISAAGSTTWELSFMGVPSILLCYADNQQAVAAGMDEAGAGISLDFRIDAPLPMLADVMKDLLSDRGRRERMSMRARALVDGRGAERVVKMLLA